MVGEADLRGRVLRGWRGPARVGGGNERQSRLFRYLGEKGAIPFRSGKRLKLFLGDAQPVFTLLIARLTVLGDAELAGDPGSYPEQAAGIFDQFRIAGSANHRSSIADEPVSLLLIRMGEPDCPPFAKVAETPAGDHAARLSRPLVIASSPSIAQFSQLRVLKCQFGQGYLFARPMPYRDLVTWLASSAANMATGASYVMDGGWSAR